MRIGCKHFLGASIFPVQLFFMCKRFSGARFFHLSFAQLGAATAAPKSSFGVAAATPRSSVWLCTPPVKVKCKKASPAKTFHMQK